MAVKKVKNQVILIKEFSGEKLNIYKFIFVISSLVLIVSDKGSPV